MTRQQPGNGCLRMKVFTSVVEALSCVQLFAAPWTAAHQASLSFTSSQSLLKLMFTELVMPSNFCNREPKQQQLSESCVQLFKTP